MTSYGFDGVDVALEFSDEDVPEDKLALTTLLEVCRNSKNIESFLMRILQEIAKQKRLMSRSIVTLTVAPFVDHLLKVYDVQKIEK